MIKFRNIGDVLLTTPLIKNLKLNYPDSKIDMVVNKGTEDILKNNPNIDRVFTYDREFYKSLPKVQMAIEELKFLKSFKDYDIVINTTEGDRGAFIAKFSRAKIRVGYVVKKNLLLKSAFNYKMPQPTLIRHIIDNNLDAIRVLKKRVFEKRVEIFWTKSDKDRVDSFIPDNFIHIHPVSRWLFKCLDDKIIAQIIDFLEDGGKKVVLTASSDKRELDKIDSILNHCKSDPINLSGKFNLNEIAYLASRAKLFIGVDTAIMHIAAAVDTPVVAFFGPSGAFNWGPWDNSEKESSYKNRNGIQKMGKHIVIQHNWECIPCGKDGCNGTKISDCLMNFDMKKIFSIIEERV